MEAGRYIAISADDEVWRFDSEEAAREWLAKEYGGGKWYTLAEAIKYPDPSDGKPVSPTAIAQHMFSLIDANMRAVAEKG